MRRWVGVAAASVLAWAMAAGAQGVRATRVPQNPLMTVTASRA